MIELRTMTMGCRGKNDRAAMKAASGDDAETQDYDNINSRGKRQR